MKTICLNYFFLLALHQVWDRGLHRIKWGFGKLPKNHKCYEQEAAPSWIPCWSVNRRCCVNGDCAFVSRPPRPEGHPTSLLCGGWGWEWGVLHYCSGLALSDFWEWLHADPWSTGPETRRMQLYLACKFLLAHGSAGHWGLSKIVSNEPLMELTASTNILFCYSVSPVGLAKQSGTSGVILVFSVLLCSSRTALDWGHFEVCSSGVQLSC